MGTDSAYQFGPYIPGGVIGASSVWLRGVPTDSLGLTPDRPGLDCTHLRDEEAYGWSGTFWIDPNGGDTADSFLTYCDMATDGGGWTLVAWTGNSSQSPYGIPYPGLAYCPTLDCLRGSAVPQDQATPLLQRATEFGKGQTEAGVFLPSFVKLGSYPYAGKYVYGPMTDASMVYGAAACNDYRTGIYHPLAGPDDFDGVAVYVDDNLHYPYGPYDLDTGFYCWNVGVPAVACNNSGAMPGSWMGTWDFEQFGPYLARVAGGSSVWFRGGTTP
jgi:hypothetical protein